MNHITFLWFWVAAATLEPSHVHIRDCPFLVFTLSDFRNASEPVQCLGAIISGFWLLAPAHCVSRPNLTLRNVKFLAGRSQLTKSCDELRKVQDVRVHPLGDYALLKAVEELRFSDVIQPASLGRFNRRSGQLSVVWCERAKSGDLVLRKTGIRSQDTSIGALVLDDKAVVGIFSNRNVLMKPWEEQAWILVVTGLKLDANSGKFIQVYSDGSQKLQLSLFPVSLAIGLRIILMRIFYD